MSNIDKQDRQVSRYDLVSGYMQKWPDGEFVYHSDYQALLDELEAKDKQIDDLKATAAHSNAGWTEAHRQEARAEAAEKRIAELEELEVNFSLPAELTVEDCDVLARTIEYGTGWNLAISSCEEKFIHALNSAGIRINRED